MPVRITIRQKYVFTPPCHLEANLWKELNAVEDYNHL
jgi:hypothetical protein